MQLALSWRLLLVAIQFLMLTMALPNAERVIRPVMVSFFFPPIPISA